MDGVRERYPGSHVVLEFMGNPEFFAFCWRGIDAVGIEMGPRGTSAPDMACLGWVSSALRTGGPGVVAVLSVWVLVAPWGECVLSHPVLQGTAAPTGSMAP